MKRRNAVGVRADDRHGLERRKVQRQDAVVFQKHHAAPRRVQRRLRVPVAVVGFIGNLVVFVVVAEQPQQVAARERAHARLRDFFLSHAAFLQRLQQHQIRVSAVDVAAVLQRQRRAFRRGVGDLVELVEIRNRAAVGDIVSLKAPLAAQDVAHQALGAAARLAVHAVVRAHDSFHAALLHAGLKRGQIGIPQVVLGYLGVKAVAHAFRAGMHGEVLGARRRLHIIPVPLNALDEANAQTRGEIRVFAVGLLSASPARVAVDVDVGRPEGQSLIDAAVSVRGLRVELGARLGGDHVRDFLHQVFVKNRGQADGLWEHRSRACAGNAVQRLVPPVVCGDTQPFNGGRVITQLRSLLLNGHLRHKLFSQRPGGTAIHIDHAS